MKTQTSENQLAKDIAEYMDRHGLGQALMGQKLGVSEWTIREILNKGKISKKAARAFEALEDGEMPPEMQLLLQKADSLSALLRSHVPVPMKEHEVDVFFKDFQRLKKQMHTNDH